MKKVRGTFLSVIFTLLLSLDVYAHNEITEQSVKEYLPKQLTDFLGEYGFEKFSAKELIDVSLSDILNYILEIVKNELKSPLVIIYIFITVVLLASIALGIGNKYFDGTIEKNFSVVSVLTICTTAVIPILTVIDGAQKFIQNTASFIKAFVPCLSAIMMAGGKTLKGAGYQIALVTASEILASFLSSVLIPVLILLLCFSIVSRVSPELRLGSFISGIKSVILWSLTLITTLFVSFITIKGAITGGADSLALRTGKFFLGNFIPAIGGALSEAASSVVSGINLIENTAGIFGIIAIILYFIPILIRVLLYKFACDISAGIGECLGAGDLSLLMRDISSVLGLINAVILNFAALFVLSTAITLIFGGKG